MRFLADMGVSPKVVFWLRQRGHDASHLREEGLQKLPDKEIFRKAVAENRTILTFDLDFGEIAAFSEGGTGSVVVFRLRNTRPSHVITRLDAVLAVCSSRLEKNGVVVIEETRHRIRYLPVGEGG